MWNVPLAKRPFKRHPGHHTFAWVGWALGSIGFTIGASVVALIGYVALISVRL